MSDKLASENQLGIDLVLVQLQRVGNSREVIALLTAKLIELSNPKLKVEFASDSEIKMTQPDGKSGSMHLQNLWIQCERDPEECAEIVQRYVRVLARDEDATTARQVSPENVVALVRDSTYRDFIKSEDGRDQVTRHLIGDLWVIYAIDLPDSTNIMNGKELTSLELRPDELLELGVNNIERLLGQVQFSPHGEIYSLSCENLYYASSTLLLGYIWEQAAAFLKDELVLGVPARDTVIFTGVGNKEGLRQIREQANHVVTHGDHVITETLLRHVNGNWKLYS